jgi:hypothetical protein
MYLSYKSLLILILLAFKATVFYCTFNKDQNYFHGCIYILNNKNHKAIQFSIIKFIKKISNFFAHANIIDT